MNGLINDDTAIAFAYRFYSSLGFGKSVEKSFAQALVEIDIQGYKGVDIPKLFIKDGVSVNEPFLKIKVKENLTAQNPCIKIITKSIINVEKSEIKESEDIVSINKEFMEQFIFIKGLLHNE